MCSSKEHWDIYRRDAVWLESSIESGLKAHSNMKSVGNEAHSLRNTPHTHTHTHTHVRTQRSWQHRVCLFWEGPERLVEASPTGVWAFVRGVASASCPCLTAQWWDGGSHTEGETEELLETGVSPPQLLKAKGSTHETVRLGSGTFCVAWRWGMGLKQSSRLGF